jgi:hypothetical protein
MAWCLTIYIVLSAITFEDLYSADPALPADRQTHCHHLDSDHSAVPLHIDDFIMRGAILHQNIQLLHGFYHMGKIYVFSIHVGMTSQWSFVLENDFLWLLITLHLTNNSTNLARRISFKKKKRKKTMYLVFTLGFWNYTQKRLCRSCLFLQTHNKRC